MIMDSKRRLGDRREHVRFDVAGQLWASLELSEQVVLRNIGGGGALVEAKLPEAIRTARTAQIDLGGRGREVNVIVRHVSPVTTAPENERYLLGLEFINLSPDAQADIDQFVRDWSG